MAYPDTSETAASLYLENIDLQRVVLALQERFRARDKVPGIAVNAANNLGTSPAAPTIVVPSFDWGGTLTISSGTGAPAAGKLVDVTFSGVYSVAPVAVILFPASLVSGPNAPQFFVLSTDITAAKFTISCTVAFPTSTLHTLAYIVVR